MGLIYAFKLFFVTLLFIMMFDEIAKASCEKSNGSIFAETKCNREPVRLNNLFKWKEEVVQKRVVPTALQFAPRETSRTGSKRYLVQPDLPKIEKHTSPKPIVLRSLNKRLSEFGHRKAAEILVSCVRGRLLVQLHFPGYPMSESARPVNIAYQVNAGAPWTMTFLPTRDLFKVEINGIASVDLFLASIASGEYVDIFARDIENTLITANFDMRKAVDELHGLKKSCHA